MEKSTITIDCLIAEIEADGGNSETIVKAIKAAHKRGLDFTILAHRDAAGNTQWTVHTTKPKQVERVKVGTRFLQGIPQQAKDLHEDIKLTGLTDERATDIELLRLLGRGLTPAMIVRICYALAVLLARQSEDNGDSHAPLVGKEGKLWEIDGRVQYDDSGQPYQSGLIETTATDVARIAFGVDAPNGEQIKQIKAAINVLHNTYIQGKTFKVWTINKKLIYTKKIQGAEAEVMQLELSPLFTDLTRGYSTIPVNVFARLNDNITFTTLCLLNVFALQRAGASLTYKTETLIKRAQLRQYLTKQGARAAAAKLEAELSKLEAAGIIQYKQVEGGYDVANTFQKRV